MKKTFLLVNAVMPECSVIENKQKTLRRNSTLVAVLNECESILLLYFVPVPSVEPNVRRQ